jgi:hypothetical protein
MDVRRRLYYGLIYPLVACGITEWVQSVKAPTRRIFTLQKRTVRHMDGLKQLESCRDSFRQLKPLTTVYLLYIQETILCKRKV